MQNLSHTCSLITTYCTFYISVTEQQKKSTKKQGLWSVWNVKHTWPARSKFDAFPSVTQGLCQPYSAFLSASKAQHQRGSAAFGMQSVLHFSRAVFVLQRCSVEPNGSLRITGCRGFITQIVRRPPVWRCHGLWSSCSINDVRFMEFSALYVARRLLYAAWRVSLSQRTDPHRILGIGSFGERRCAFSHRKAVYCNLCAIRQAPRCNCPPRHNCMGKHDYVALPQVKAGNLKILLVPWVRPQDTTFCSSGSPAFWKLCHTASVCWNFAHNKEESAVEPKTFWCPSVCLPPHKQCLDKIFTDSPARTTIWTPANILHMVAQHRLLAVSVWFVSCDCNEGHHPRKNENLKQPKGTGAEHKSLEMAKRIRQYCMRPCLHCLRRRPKPAISIMIVGFLVVAHFPSAGSVDSGLAGNIRPSCFGPNTYANMASSVIRRSASPDNKLVVGISFLHFLPSREITRT